MYIFLVAHAVFSQVNAGPLEICRIFLGAPPGEYPKEAIDKLKEVRKLYFLSLLSVFPSFTS
jgi:hypothetical protein